VTVALGALATWRLGPSSEASSKRAGKPLAVEAVAVRAQPMPIFFQATGQVQPEHTVQVRPQVSGLLQEVYFTEGQAVSKGDRLFRIDPSQYEAALEAARAEWAYAKEQAERLAPLAGKEYVTSQELDNARVAVDKALAALKQAEINLAYTEIRAPISGRTGSVGAKPGNVVAPGDAAPLVVLNQMQPIVVQYSIPQQQLAELRRYQARQSIRIFITHEDGGGDLGEGELVFVDNAVNTDTGTLLLKARLPNRNEQLWPGQYVGVRTQFTVQPNALVVPQSAIQTGQNGNFVYAVEDGSATIRAVQVDRQVGDLAVIADGLKAGETVVARAPRNLRQGVKVIALEPARQQP
jgi:multidrug efflux system membrane fusion protein